MGEHVSQKMLMQFCLFQKSFDIEMNTISGGWKTNLKVRSEKDWEDEEGRSVSFKNKIG